MIEILVIEYHDPVIMDGPVVLLSIYRSPQSQIKEFFSELDHVMRKTDYFCYSIITGDFNINLFA